MNKFLSYYLRFALTFLVASMATVFIWVFYPYQVTDFQPQPFVVSTPTVRAGENMTYRYHYCKYNNFKLVSVTKYLLDGQVIALTSDEAHTPHKIGCGDVERSIEIPKSIYPDRYRLKVVSVFQVNPIRTIEVITYTEAFDVIK